MCPAEKEVPCCAPRHCPDLTHGSDDPCYNISKQYSNRIKLNTSNKMSDFKSCAGYQLSSEIFHGFLDHFK
jgi:hypothetical protein